ncbi:MAG: HAMP domain-containing histidine kinase [Burkholderiaceae bacterium]|jgi:signal transduction histidine kinase|nr:HAMP domain-containing histidine kinase [Burkholderiaceae bacterium]
MNLNLATAAVFSALVEFALFIGMLVLWSREKVRYLIYWSLGFLAFGIGSLLIALRGRIPDFLTILTANISTTLSSVLFYIGICLFFKRRRSWLLWMLVVLCLEAAGLAYYTYLAYDTSARVYVYSCAQILIMCMTFQTLVATARERDKAVNPEVIVVTLLFLLFHCARIAGTPFFPVPQDFLASGNFQTMLAFGIMLVHIDYAFAFSNMHASSLSTNLYAALTDAKNKERQKVEVLGYISHDLRAPLATISGYSKLLLADAPQEQRNLLQTIERSVKYQLDLIDELLEYAKSELQPLAIKPAIIDLHRQLDDISDYAIALCSQHDNRFRCCTSKRMPRHIGLDGKRLQQVLLNLLSNAAKFTRDGTVTLSVTAKPEGNTCALHFAVSDTGIGIDLNQNVDIFGAFQQIQAASGSTGLGLFIAQRILSAMGSSLGVASTPGQGTTFSFVLSVAVIDTSSAGWPRVAPTRARVASRTPPSALPRDGIPSETALDELADLALHGRLTDIEAWIELHANESAHAPFLALVRELLDQFDFPAIHALALHNRNRSSI